MVEIAPASPGDNSAGPLFYRAGGGKEWAEAAFPRARGA